MDDDDIFDDGDDGKGIKFGQGDSREKGNAFNDDQEDGEVFEVSQREPLQPSQTQADVKGLINSIFGDDDSDDDENVAPTQTKYNFVDDDDEGLQGLDDSDDDYATTNKRKRLSKANKSLTRSPDVDASAPKKKKKLLKKSRAITTTATSIEPKLKKKIKSSRDQPSILKDRIPRSATDAVKNDGHESGDEYDSGEDMQRTEEDDKFIAAEDDEQAEIMKEYDQDEQNFDGERPEGSGIGKKKSSSSSHVGSTSKDVADQNPLSLTMNMLKKPKEAVLSDADKARIATDLMTKMDQACRQDEECFRLGQPAVHKLRMLPTVKQLVALRPLQHTLLDYDILNVFKDWIEPRDAKTLPSLPVRTAIYEMLLQLPCQTDHLKRAPEGRQPIGATIVALRKHALETPENKRLLRDLMEKWCRPVFGKSTDARNMSLGREASEELRAVLRQQTIQKQKELQLRQDQQTHGQSGSAGGFDAALGSAASGGISGGANRVRAPYSSGFLFTVQPEYVDHSAAGHGHGVDNGEAREVNPKRSGSGGGLDALSEPRRLLEKALKENRRKGAAGVSKVGVKQSTRAINVALTGRNKV